MCSSAGWSDEGEMPAAAGILIERPAGAPPAAISVDSRGQHVEVDQPQTFKPIAIVHAQEGLSKRRFILITNLADGGDGGDGRRMWLHA